MAIRGGRGAAATARRWGWGGAPAVQLVGFSRCHLNRASALLWMPAGGARLPHGWRRHRDFHLASTTTGAAVSRGGWGWGVRGRGGAGRAATCLSSAAGACWLSAFTKFYVGPGTGAAACRLSRLVLAAAQLWLLGIPGPAAKPDGKRKRR
jgi:hypothetical protein